MACRTSPTTVVNHTYRSLPHTPLINNGSQISHHNRLHHQQPKEQHDRRRSYGGEKKSENNIGGDERLLGSVKLAKQVPTEAPLLPPPPPLPPPLIEPDAPSASGSYFSSTAAGSEAKQRFRLRPLVSSKSSENFNHLRRAAMETVTNSVELNSSQAIPIEWVLILNCSIPFFASRLLQAAASTNSSRAPVTLLGYKSLKEISPPSNSESLPDLKYTPSRSPRYLRILRRSRATVTHSFSDPSLVVRHHSNKARSKDNDRVREGRALLKHALAEVKADGPGRLVADELASSQSDCSEQSGWVSSALSSHVSSPLRQPLSLNLEEEMYPDLAPLAPPEEFQVSLSPSVKATVFGRIPRRFCSSFGISLKDPPLTRLKSYAPRFNLNSILNVNLKDRDVLHGIPGTYHRIAQDDEDVSNDRGGETDTGILTSSPTLSFNRNSRPRPLSHEVRSALLIQYGQYLCLVRSQPDPD